MHLLGPIARAAASVVLSGMLAHAPVERLLVPPAAASTRADLFSVGNAERCEMGTGDACERLAGGSEYVRKLQERTKAKRAEYEKSMFGASAPPRPAAPAHPRPPAVRSPSPLSYARRRAQSKPCASSATRTLWRRRIRRSCGCPTAAT